MVSISSIRFIRIYTGKDDFQLRRSLHGNGGEKICLRSIAYCGEMFNISNREYNAYGSKDTTFWEYVEIKLKELELSI